MRCGDEAGIRWDHSRVAHQDWCRHKMVDLGFAPGKLAAQAESDVRQNTNLRCELKNRPGPIAKERGPIGPAHLSPIDIEKHKMAGTPIRVEPVIRKFNTSNATGSRCRSGFVWREANAMDKVCVTPASRELIARENGRPDAHRAPRRGAICASGFVWREAFGGDTACVSPARRDAVRDENRLATHRRQ